MVPHMVHLPLVVYMFTAKNTMSEQITLLNVFPVGKGDT